MKKTILLLIIISFACIGASSLISGNFEQDPARTPKEPGMAGPVTTVDGSTGKYRKKHKHPTGKNFARRKKHADTVKPTKKTKEKTPPQSIPKGS